MGQIERVVYLDEKLRAHQPVALHDVAAHFGVCERQVKRDIEYLRKEMGAPVEWNRLTRSYEYTAAFNKLKNASQDMVLSYVVLESFSRNQNYAPAISKEILSGIAENISPGYRAICPKISYEIPQVQSINPDYFFLVCDAMQKKQCLEIHYTNLKGEDSTREIEAEKLINYGGVWYIIAFDHLRDALRTFHVSRISAVRLTETPYNSHKAGYPRMKDGFAFKDYEAELERYISGGFGIFKGGAQTLVRILFTGTARHIVKSQAWHPAQKATETAEGLELRFPATSFTEIVAHILSFAGEARPLEPPELVSAWKEKVAQLAKLAEEV